MNRVMDYIGANLNGGLCLEKLAGVADFSPYHFHRVFRGMTGETLNTFIRRTRAETAAMKLINNPKMTITAIAMHRGFSSSASFAREFRTFFGMSTSQFRRDGLKSLSKPVNRKARSENRFAWKSTPGV